MYQNYGDKHFFEHGRLVDDEHTGITIIYCEPYPDEADLYQFAEVDVDVNDEWIDKDKVCKYAGLKNPSDIDLALAALDYYGPEEFGAGSREVFFDWRRATKECILVVLKHRMIDYTNLSLE